MVNPVHEFYGNRLRIRASGICIDDDGVLLVKHQMPNSTNFWSPPGGGVEFGESTNDCLVREFREETGLIIEPKEFLFITEFIAPPLHAIELFFSVEKIGGQLAHGVDPELKDQIIKEVKFIPWSELQSWNRASLHGIFQKWPNPQKSWI